MTNEETVTVDHARMRSTGSTVLALIAIGLCALVELVVLATRHRFERIYRDFGLDLSSISGFAVGPALPLLLAIIIVTAAAKEFVPDLRRVANAWNVAVLLSAVVLFVLYVVGVFSAVESLIGDLSS
jgi:hypothetical protein